MSTLFENAVMMSQRLFLETPTTADLSAIPIILIHESQFETYLASQTEFVKNWISTQQFKAKKDSHCQIPSPTGKLQCVLVSINGNDFNIIGTLPKTLPENTYQLNLDFCSNKEESFIKAALAFSMGAYSFTPYKTNNDNATKKSTLIFPQKFQQEIRGKCEAIYWIRHLINTPAQDMNPAALSREARKLAEKFGASFHEIIGEALQENNYPAIYAVGKASNFPPQLIDFTWGNPEHPKITLVGKGVCFDTGGLDIKPSQGMGLMKKDMGGAAHVLGLAYLIMLFQFPIRLRVLIPAVENAVSGNAYRPGDVIRSRQGLHIEIGNTDAEGRVILCDALTEAACENPALIIDFATLTGAARIAGGTDLPVFFCNDEELNDEIVRISKERQEPICPLPLHAPYRKLLDSSIADINNAGSSSYGGAITAALFLKEFIPDDTKWMHFDIMAWNLTSSPAHPEGGEAMGLNVVFDYLRKTFCARSSAG